LNVKGKGMRIIESVSELEALYDVTVQGAIDKVCDHITPLYRRWIDASRFVILSTVGPEGTDASPRGDRDEVVRIANPKTVLTARLAGQQSARLPEKHCARWTT
jgi:predicted pyridoxine 5'-phosphate oxidase superfamily flavin-nucleotide-binding protein